MEKIFFYMPGACSLAGQVALEWAAKPYSLCRVQFPDLSNPAFRAINPQGKVPALKVGARHIFENPAVLAHIADNAPEQKLLPAAGTEARDEANMWLSYFASTFHTAFTPMFAPMRFIEDAAQYDAVKKAAVARIRNEYAYVNKHLETNQCILGDTRSILDPYLFAMARWGKAAIDIDAEYPHLARHLNSIAQDAAVQLVLAIEQDAAAAEKSAYCQGHVSLA